MNRQANLVRSASPTALAHRLAASLCGAGLLCLAACACWARDAPARVDPESPSGLDYYSQGGVVVDGVAYFTANDHSRRPGVARTDKFPCVVAFDTRTFKKIRAYNFGFTYDSSPLVFQQRDGTWLVAAHEYKNARTVAMNRATGAVAWTSAANEPGSYFFGYSYYRQDDGARLLLMACTNGLHALSSETGADVWWLKWRSTGGITPCVDQANGLVFAQCDGKVLKIRAADGQVLQETAVSKPHRCISWNTMLVDDRHGYYVATRWYGKPEWDSAIRVYDRQLHLVWEATGLPIGKKDTLTYTDGKLISGSGNSWSKKYTGRRWKVLTAYSIADGRPVWRCDLSGFDYQDILNVPYWNGYLYAENNGSPPQTTRCFRIDAGTGKLAEVYHYGRAITSCATHIVAHGKIFSGDLWQDRIVVTRLANNSAAQWPGPFGDPQTNQMAAGDEPGVRLVPIEEIGRDTAPAADPRPNLARLAKITAASRIHGAQADPQRMIDNQRQSRWSSGPGDLVLAPLDVDLHLREPQVVDTLTVVTSALKGQLRLKDFDVYAGLDGAWDGARPLARVRDNRNEVVRVSFAAVRLDSVRLRLLGTRRPDNAFAHIAELSLYAAARPPQRQVAASPFAPSPADAGHDPDALRVAIAGLAAADTDANVAGARRALETRLRLVEESRTYEAVLDRISADTARYRKLAPPEWALAQRDCMARLRNWAYYWIDHQQPDGQFGGGYEDDVELVCGWPVLVLAQDDAKVHHALRLLADGVWKSRPFLERFGYDRLTDVEHAAENTSYSQPRMVVLEPAESKWAERCRRTVATLAEHFLSRNEKGALQFRSDYFGFDPKTLKPVTRQRERPFDIPEAAKALKPAMYAVWASGDSDARRVMLDYGRTWLDAAAAAGPERVEGLLPERVEWPSGRAVGTHAAMASMRATLFHLIGCYYVSGDDRFLQPIRSLLHKSLGPWSVNGVPSAGSLGKVRAEDWTSTFEQLALVAALYRRATGDDQFDAQLARWAERIRTSLVDGVKSYVLLDRQRKELWYIDRPLAVGAYRESRCSVGAELYLGWLVTADDDYLARLGWNLSSTLTDKWGAFTYWFYDKSEPRVTSNDHLAHKLQTSASALSLMYLGGPGPVEAVWPQLAVSWQGVGNNFCALVRRNADRRLLVHLYNFDSQPRQITANLWELEPGSYQAVAGPLGGADGSPSGAVWRAELTVADAGAPDSNAVQDSSARNSQSSGRSRSRETSGGIVNGPNSDESGYQNPSRRSPRRPTPVTFTLPPRTPTALLVRPRR